MNPELQEMKAAMDAMRGELNAMKTRLEKLESVVRIHDSPDGRRSTSVRCESIVIMHRRDDGEQQAAFIGSSEAGGYLHMSRFAETKYIAVWLGVDNEDNQPKIEFYGMDAQPQATLGCEKNHGILSLLGPGHVPGVVARARPGGGGSVAVLQKDGKPHAVLSHDEGGGFNGQPKSELTFFTSTGQIPLKLLADENISVLAMSGSDNHNAVMLSVAENLPVLALRGPDKTTNIHLAAGKDMAAVKVAQGCQNEWDEQNQKAEASLLAGDFGSSVNLHDKDGVRRVDLSAMEKCGSLCLQEEEGLDGIKLSHLSGQHSSLTLRGAANHDCLSLLVTKHLSSLRVISPEWDNTEIAIWNNLNEPQIFLRQNGEPLVMVSQQEQGGVVSAFGRKADEGGSANLLGGKGGTVSISTRDGIPLATLEGTDHGGRFQLFNDLGFQRVLAGVHEENAMLALNNTGTQGFSAVCTEAGGIVTLHDAAGAIVQSLPPRQSGDSDDEDSEEET